MHFCSWCHGTVPGVSKILKKKQIWNIQAEAQTAGVQYTQSHHQNQKTFSVCIVDLPHIISINFLSTNPVLITSKSSAENKSKGLSEAFVLISSASNSFPTSKFPITSSSPRAEEENKLINTFSGPASFHHVAIPGNLLEIFLRQIKIQMIMR